MKKTLLSMVCLMMVGILSVNAQRRIALQHEGTATFFYPDQTQAALDTAVDGDTIYFDAGEFTGDITISKRVTLIGAGSDTSKPYTTIKGKIYIAMSKGSETLTARLLEGIAVNGDVIIQKAIIGLNISRSSLWSGLWFDASTESAVVESSYLEYLNLSSKIGSLTVNNSKIYHVEDKCDESLVALNAIFNNCNIFYIYNDEIKCNGMGTYMNCIINGAAASAYFKNNTKFVNCLTSFDYGTAENYNCWYSNGYLLISEGSSYECKFSSEELEERGYIGTDGKVVGIHGGNLIFTQSTNAPKITDFNTKVDPETLEVTVNLKVTNN